MDISDQELTAFVAGELEPAACARIEAAMALDAAVAHRVAQQRALRERMRSRFDGAAHDPLPQRLSDGARVAASAGPLRAPAQIIDLARVRAERSRRANPRHRTLSRRVAIAASLIAGLFAGLLIERLSLSTPWTLYEDGQVYARGELSRSLSRQIAADPVSAGQTRVGVTFRSKSGQYCRAFGLPGVQGMDGLACRRSDQWQLVALLSPGAPSTAASAAAPASAPTATNPLTVIAALPTALRQAIEQRISGVPLSGRAETQARASGWH